MKEFLLIIRLPLSYGPEDAASVRGNWNALTEKWKSKGIFVTSFIAPADGVVVEGKDRNATKKAIVSSGTKVISNLIIRTTDMERAVHLAKMCPILDQDGTVEVREVQPRINRPLDLQPLPAES